MSDYFGLLGNYQEIEEGTLRKMVGKALGSGEPRVKVQRGEQFYLCAVNHGRHDATTVYADPLERYTLMLYGYIASYDLLESELRSRGIKPENNLMALLLQAYKVSTPDFVDLLRGNFSLLIADSGENKIFLAKDHFGSCPLYYSGKMRNGVRFFGTNIAAMAEHPDFEKEFNPEPLAYYLSLEYNPMRESFWRNVFTLPSGHWALISEDELREEAYFTPSFATDERSLYEHVEEIYDGVERAVNLYSEGEAEKLGSYLSGGVDSSFVTVLAQPEQVFSLGYEGFTGMFDESVPARELAQKHDLNFTATFVSGKDYVSAVLRSQENLNEPNGNLSTVALCLLGNAVDEKVSYILTGDGADEFFGGYDTYLAPGKQRELYSKLIPKRLRSFVSSRIKADIPYYSRVSTIKHSGMELSQYFFGTSRIFSSEILDEVLNAELMPAMSLSEFFSGFYNEHSDEDELTQKMLLDINYLLPGNMSVKAERMANAHNLQLRTPLLNKSIFDIARTIPADMRVSASTSKIPFRKAAARLLDDEWAKNRKLGFPVPFRYFLKDKTIAQPLYDILNDPLVDRYFRRETVDRYLYEHLEQKRARHMELYVIMAFVLWYKDKFAD
ncbi:MAG: asparagine synthase-related protein [Eubacteriales bacterium]|nr:asparagine synthase-related protein [Eubacteriales bacterium]MDD4541274.1 asparagine synthase-related protein [Eubacteriales bacterium]